MANKMLTLGLKGASMQLVNPNNQQGDGHDAVFSHHAAACTSQGVGPVMVRRQQAMSVIVENTHTEIEDENPGIHPIDVDPADNDGKATMTLNLGSTNGGAEESIEIVETNCIYTDNNYGQTD